MKNNKGFMATSIIYAFFIVFLMILAALLAYYSHNRVLLNHFKDSVREGIEKIVEQPQDTFAYLWYDGSDVTGPSIGEDASSLATSVPTDKNFYLKFKLDDTNKVTNSYVCAIFGGKKYCVEGGGYDETTETSPYYGWNTDAAHSTGNVKVLYDIRSANIEGVSCYFSSGGSDCYDDSVYVYANLYGEVGVDDNVGYCEVNGDGSSSCDVLW